MTKGRTAGLGCIADWNAQRQAKHWRSTYKSSQPPCGSSTTPVGGAGAGRRACLPASTHRPQRPHILGRPSAVGRRRRSIQWRALLPPPAPSTRLPSSSSSPPSWPRSQSPPPPVGASFIIPSPLHPRASFVPFRGISGAGFLTAGFPRNCDQMDHRSWEAAAACTGRFSGTRPC